MRRRTLLGLAFTGLAFFAYVGVPSAQGPPPVSVAVQQLDWLDADGNVAAASSTAALAEFTFSPEASELAVGPDGAYLNLYTSVDGGATYQLAVENLVVHFNSEADLLASRLTALIDLGNEDETAVGDLSYQVSLTRDPVDAVGGGEAAPERSFAADSRTPTPTSTGTPYPSPTPYPTPTPYPSPTPVPSPSPGLDEIYFRPGVENPGDIPSDYVEPAPAPIYTSRPLPGAAVQVTLVQRTGYFFGGFGGGGIAIQGRPPRPHPFRPVLRPRPPQPQPPPPPPGRPRPVGAVQGPIQTINEGPMTCAPSGIARSIAYMLNQRGRPADAQAIMGVLAGQMGTNAGGTSLQGMLNGKAAFNAANNLGITTVYPASAATAANALNNGGDVELAIVWPNTRPRGCAFGGHVAMVTSIVQLPNGNFQITYVDDPIQGDGQPSNVEHTLIVAPNGLILSGSPCPGGVVAGLVAENMP